MPERITSSNQINLGDFYEDCYYHPCLCTLVWDGCVSGISLVDGTYPRDCSIEHYAIRKLTPEEAIHWRFYGPSDVVLSKKDKWWIEYDFSHPKFGE